MATLLRVWRVLHCCPSPWRGCLRGHVAMAPAVAGPSTVTRRRSYSTPTPQTATDASRAGKALESGVKTSPMKLNLVAKLIRGMSIKNAIIQMEVSEKKAAKFVLSTVLDTQRRAAETHDLDPRNLYIAESYVGKGHYLKRIRYHGRGMHGIMHKTYSHYFLRLGLGAPPPKPRRSKEDHKSFKTKKLILAGPRSIPNAL